MRRIYFYLLLIAVFSCKNDQVPNQESVPQTLKPVVTAEKLIDLSVKAAGLDKLYNATLTFEKKGVNYSAKRDGYAYEYIMTRTKKGKKYVAIASNGNFEYTEDGKYVSYGSQNTLLEQKLIFDNNLLAIPKLFKNDNSISASVVGQIEVKNIDYHVIQIHFKDQLPSDQMRNVRVYINPKSLLPDYICYAYGDVTRLLWMESTTRHNLDGLIVSDYKTYIPRKATDKHSDMVLYFNTGALKETEHVKYKNLQLISN